MVLVLEMVRERECFVSLAALCVCVCFVCVVVSLLLTVLRMWLPSYLRHADDEPSKDCDADRGESRAEQRK